MTAAPPRPKPPEGYKLVYEGRPLPTFYAAEMLRPLIGKTVWVMDSGHRVRSGELREVPTVRQDAGDAAPAEFTDEKPLYLRGVVCIAVYEPPK